MNVFKFTFGKEADGRFTVTPIMEVICPQQLYDVCAWDKIVRMDLVDGDTIVFMSIEKVRLEDFVSGMGAYRTIPIEWDNIFNAENKRIYNENLQKMVNEENLMPAVKQGESRKDYVGRCVPYVMKNESLKQEQAVGKCEGMYSSHTKAMTEEWAKQFLNTENIKPEVPKE